MRGFKAFALAALAGLLVGSFPTGSALSRDLRSELRREKARLLEMKKKEEKTAAELSEALRKEKLTKERVAELQQRLKSQRGVIRRIDRRISTLGKRQSEKEKEVKEVAEARDQARSGLRQTVVLAFEGLRAGRALPAERLRAERVRQLMGRYLGADLRDVERLSREKDRKEKELSGIEHQVKISERKMARERKVGEKLLSRHKQERKRLSGIEKEKERKKKELLALRRKIARMASVVARVERLAKERERRLRKKAGRGKGMEESPPPPGDPKRFASLAGGIAPPMSGKVVTRFGKQHDPTFDVTIENHGVELEGASGAWVKAAAAGEVAFTGAVSGYGNVLILQHGSGLFSVYGKLDSFLVKTGQSVVRGQVLGRLPESPSGKSVLYFELRAGGTAVNPSSVIPLK